jgi:hypothetical protein
MSKISIPDTLARQQLATWLATLNTGNMAEILAHHELHFPYKSARPDVRNINREVALRRSSGGFHVRSIRGSEETRLTVSIKERDSSQFASVVIESG